MGLILLILLVLLLCGAFSQSGNWGYAPGGMLGLLLVILLVLLLLGHVPVGW